MIGNEENKQVKATNLAKSDFTFNEKIGYELIFYSMVFWLMVSFGFKFNELKGFLDISKLSVSSIVFALCLIVFFIFSFTISFKLSLNIPNLEFLFIFILSFSTGIILQTLTGNLKNVYEPNSYINQDSLNWVFSLTMIVYSLII